MPRVHNTVTTRIAKSAIWRVRRAARWISAPVIVISIVAGLGGCASLARTKTDQTIVSGRQLALRGMTASQQGRLREAEVFFSRAAEICPLDERIRCHYAETLWQLGSRRQAVAHMEEAVRLSGGNADLAVRLGDMYLETNQLEQASAQADAAIQANRHLAEAWALRGDVLRALGRDDDALAAYHRAISLQGHYPRSQLASAEIYTRQQRHARALATLRTLADGYPTGETPQQVVVLQGLALKALGRYDEAVELLAAAAKQSAPTTDLLTQIAEAQWLSGDVANARLTLQTAIERSSAEQGAQPPTPEMLALQRKLASNVRL